MKFFKKLFMLAGFLGALSSSANAIDIIREKGNSNAPVVIQEFSSLTCGFCSRFHREFYPELLEKYVDTGKVKIVYRNYPLDNVALATSMLGLSLPKEKYFDYLQFAYLNQNKLVKDPLNTLYKWGKIAGLDKQKVDSILSDENLMNEIKFDKEKIQKNKNLKGTPLIFVGNKRFNGLPDKKEFFAEIEKQLN
ncbi:MAG: thioredoxin domain-containing protein [Alphaproteobacteria bacterium]|nr:thioredoxin domain-containing protein [Alphaproteobacteria bacterium]